VQSPSWEANRLQLVKKFPAFYGTRSFITELTRVRQLSLSWASSIQSITPHPNSWRSSLILSSHLRLYHAVLHFYMKLWCSKVIPDRAMEAHGETEVQLYLFLSSALNINGQLHSPAALSLVKVSHARIEYIPKVSINTSKKNLLPPCRESSYTRLLSNQYSSHYSDWAIPARFHVIASWNIQSGGH
jgi:hypothetical protein